MAQFKSTVVAPVTGEALSVCRTSTRVPGKRHTYCSQAHSACHSPHKCFLRHIINNAWLKKKTDSRCEEMIAQTATAVTPTEQGRSISLLTAPAQNSHSFKRQLATIHAESPYPWMLQWQDGPLLQVLHVKHLSNFRSVNKWELKCR